MPREREGIEHTGRIFERIAKQYERKIQKVSCQLLIDVNGEKHVQALRIRAYI